MKDISPNDHTVVVAGQFESFTPEELFAHFTDPELVVKWWPREAQIDPKVGGRYKFSWPEKNWVLEGTYTAFDPGRNLGFTWAWNFDVDTKPLQVDIRFEPAEKGAKMTVTHGPWEDAEASQIERQGIREGWIHFGMRLAGLRDGEAT
jgi:uncharacterized protein YndB with AHSA1/START domain